MNKSDYEINCHVGKANKKAEARWERLRENQVYSHSIYDIRADKRKRQTFPNWLLNKELEYLLSSEYMGRNWRSQLSAIGLEPKVFKGFISRILQGKGSSYYVECKTLDQGCFDIETGWFGIGGLNPILPEIKRYYRYAFQPYVPGNAIEISYLALNEPDTKWSTRVELHVRVEDNCFYPGPS